MPPDTSPSAQSKPVVDERERRDLRQAALDWRQRALEAESDRDRIAAAMINRIRHSATVIDADEVSRTSRTLGRIALVLEVEFCRVASDQERHE